MLMLKPKMINLMFEDEIVATIRDGGVLNYDGIYLSPARAGGNVGEGYSLVEALPPEPVPVNLVAYNAQKRWEKEISGITVGGAQIDTSRESQSMIAGAYLYSQKNPGSPIKFKASSGWVTLDAATVETIADAVGAHVQACFAIEADAAAGISAGTVTTTEQIDTMWEAALQL